MAKKGGRFFQEHGEKVLLRVAVIALIFSLVQRVEPAEVVL